MSEKKSITTNEEIYKDITNISAIQLFEREKIQTLTKLKLALVRFGGHFLALYQSLRNVHDIMPAELLLVTPACIKWSEQLNIRDPRHWQQDLMKSYGRPSEFDVYTLLNSQGMKKIKSCKRERALKVEIEKMIISEFSQAVTASTKFIKSELDSNLLPMNPLLICQELMASILKKFPSTNASDASSGVGDAIDYCDPLNYNVGGIGRRMRKFLLFRVHQLILLAENCSIDTHDDRNQQAVEIDENRKLSEQLAELTRPVTDFSLIFQQFDASTMIEIFAQLTPLHTEQIGQTEYSNSSSRLPTALVKIVNTYCDLDPLSTEDDELIVRKLLNK